MGRRPTFYDSADGAPLVEAHLLDFDGDLYGEQARVSSWHRLRDERRFDSTAELMAQMRRDIDDRAGGPGPLSTRGVASVLPRGAGRRGSVD